ncbi:MAG: hypothetical protein M1305_03905, partial [Candidatus Marsarchaeota archaeon]|nr:hypothetical protein [Candidatus Marsarchaeota archaeon]
MLKDLQILQQVHEVRPLLFRGPSDLASLLAGVRWSEITFSWFGSLHAFFAVWFSRLLCRRTIVVAGGWDVGQFDGLVHQRFKRWCPEYVFTRADLVLSVSDYNHEEALTNIKGRIKRIQRIYHGFDTEWYQPSPNAVKENIVLTVGTVASHSVSRKGLDRFIEAAHFLPNI